MLFNRVLLVVVVVFTLSVLDAAPEAGSKASIAPTFEEGMERFLALLHDNMSYQEMKSAMADYARLSALPLSEDERHFLEMAHGAAMSFVFHSVLAAAPPAVKCGPDSFWSWLGSVLTSPTDLFLLSIIICLSGYLVYDKVFVSRGLLVVNPQVEVAAPEAEPVEEGPEAEGIRLVEVVGDGDH